MFFSIIINTHNQYETISRCLKSCLSQSYKKKYEIIIIDTSDEKIDSKLILSKKIRYYHFKKFSKYPELNQLRKVYEGYKKANGKCFCLMDGDDFFKKDKLEIISKKLSLKKEILLQDRCTLYSEKKSVYYKNNDKFYKKFFLYKNLINFWPEIYGTSSLSGNMQILESFFKDVSLKKWNLLAIDALLILYCLSKNKFLFYNKVLTNKSIGTDNLGARYKIMNKNFWYRRSQQIKYWEEISNKNIFNIDKLISTLINIII